MKYLHLNIVSKDAIKLADFYINVFDCAVRSKGHMVGDWLDKGTGLMNAEINSIELCLPGYPEKYPYFEIFQYLKIEGESNIKTSDTLGFTHISFEVDDVEVTLKKAIQHGAKPYGEVAVKEFKGGILTFVYVKDPDGNIVEIENWKAK